MPSISPGNREFSCRRGNFVEERQERLGGFVVWGPVLHTSRKRHRTLPGHDQVNRDQTEPQPKGCGQDRDMS